MLLRTAHSSRFQNTLTLVLCFGLVLIFWLTPPKISGQNPSPQEGATILDLNKPTERELSAGQKHKFQITLSAGQYALAKIEQRGIDIVARVTDSDGKVLLEFDAEPRISGTETVELASENQSDLFLTIEPKQKSARPGRYQIRLVEQRAAAAKDLALDEARRLVTTAISLWWAGKYSEALPVAEKARLIRERELSAEHKDIGQILFIIGNIVGDMGDLEKCEALYAQALGNWEKAFGKEHPSIGKILLNWGAIYKLKGEYLKAENIYMRALEIWEKTLEPNHPLIASALNNLANISSERGDPEKTAAFYRRALEIREKALGAEHPEVALTLNNLATVYDDIPTAEPLYLRALAIREKVLGAEHQDVAQTLYNLARLYTLADDYEKAKPVCERALKIFEKTLGADHAFVGYPLNLLAVIYKNTNDYGQSETLYLRAAALKEKTQGAFHPELGGIYLNLANLYVLKGETEKAIRAQARGNEILEFNTALNLTIGSEREKLDYLKSLADNESQTLTLSFKTAPDSSVATNLAAESLLRRKGRILDAMSDNLGALRRRFDKQDQTLLDNLNAATTRLVGFVLEDGQNLSAEEYRRKLKTLEEERETAENQISRRSAGFYESGKTVTLGAVSALIPDQAALIEFAVYRPINHKSFEVESSLSHKPELMENSRYAVFVIDSKGETRRRDLGSVEEIDRVIDNFRTALRSPKSLNVRKLAREADEKIMKPVRALLGDAKLLLVSPDGALNLIPFEALVDEKGQYLIENYSFSYLTSGRDLTRMQTARQSKNKSLIIANPSFGEPPTEQFAGITANGKTLAGRTRQSRTATRDLSETFFAPLSGTTEEARSIHSLFPDASFLSGELATESALKKVAAPQILHVATHGFFLQNDENSFINNSQTTSRGNNTNSKIENPLLRSGLALAGANRRQNGLEDDGILTSLEASGLNLWGTKLVVLSACDTGLGEVKNGEGVYGLRRAFVLAGAESLVMSLWSVSDYVTRELMTGYYKNLKQGMGRGDALKRVKLEMIKRKGREHPFYWAAFIQSGEWANLDGKR